jgi:hypothetical protein
MLGRVKVNADVDSRKSTIQEALESALNKKGGAGEKIMRAALMTRSAAHGDLKGVIESLVNVRETRKEMKNREDADQEVLTRLEYLEEALEKQTKELNKKFDRVIGIFERKPDDVIRQVATGQRIFKDSRGRELVQNATTGRFERRSSNSNIRTDKQDGLDTLRGILDYQKKIHAQGERNHKHTEKNTKLTEKAHRLYDRVKDRVLPQSRQSRFQRNQTQSYSPPGQQPGGLHMRDLMNFLPSGAGTIAGFAMGALKNKYVRGGLLGTTAGYLGGMDNTTGAGAALGGTVGSFLGPLGSVAGGYIGNDIEKSTSEAGRREIQTNVENKLQTQQNSRNASQNLGVMGRAQRLGRLFTGQTNVLDFLNDRDIPANGNNNETPKPTVTSVKDDEQVLALQKMKEELKRKIDELKRGRPARNFRDYRVDDAEKQIAGIDNQISSIRSGGIAGGAGGRAGAGGSSGPYIPGVTPATGQTDSQAQADARQQVEQSKMPAYNPQFSPGTASDATAMQTPDAPAAPTSVTDLPLQIGASGGQYRPQYNLGAADVDPKVLSVIAGEARLKNSDGSWNQEGTDAVINNMLNRVGSKGWGPSGNLLDVATAPGQYAGSRPTSDSESEYIKSRIAAIASGTVPDNTQGSNSYRSEQYYQSTKDNGKGYWAGSAEIGPNIGGNRFGKTAGTENGPYAQYADGPKGTTPAISASIPGLPGASRASLADIGPGVMGDAKNAQFASLDPSRIRPMSGESADQLATRIQKMAPDMPSQECVALAKSAVGLDATPGANSVSDWRKGEGAQDGNLVRGTPVATFLDRSGNDSNRYDGGQGTGVSGNNTTHAAVFDSYATDKDGNKTGINVWEQYAGSGGSHMKTYNFGDQRGGTKSGENYYSINSASNNNAPLGGERNPMAARGSAAAPASMAMPQAPTIPGAIGATASLSSTSATPSAAPANANPANDSLVRPFDGAAKSQFNMAGVAGRALGSNGYLGATGNVNSIGAPVMGNAQTPPEMSTPSQTFERQPTPTPTPSPAPQAANSSSAPAESKGGGSDDKSEGAGDAAGGTKKMSEIEMQINDFGLRPLNSTDAA